MSVSIKGVDERAFRNLKAEAVRNGVKVGEAATEAFRMWVASKRQAVLRDRREMLRAAKSMDDLRTKVQSKMVRSGRDSEMERRKEIVVDASVAVKWFSEEEGSARALKLRDDHVDGTTTLVAPDLLVYEIANTLRFKPGLDSQAVSKAVEDLFDLQIDLLAPTTEVVRAAAELSTQFGITIYDSSYLSLAKLLGTQVVTADHKLHEKAKGCGFLLPL